MAIFMQKRFCGAVCAELYRAENMLVCMRQPECPKKFLKKEGVPKYGKWFCSPECEAADEELLKISEESSILQKSN